MVTYQGRTTKEPKIRTATVVFCLLIGVAMLANIALGYQMGKRERMWISLTSCVQFLTDLEIAETFE